MNSGSKSVLAVAGEAGGAAALLPVLSALARCRNFQLTSFAYGAALTVWHNAGISYQQLAPDVNPGAVLRALSPGVVLTGTSLNGIDWEQQFIAAAREQGIPSIALLDFWSNYRERFADSMGNLTNLPQVIAVMDETARTQMIALGFPAARLVVTGQPALDALQELKARATPEFRRRLRSALDFADETVVLFCSQPIAQLYGDGQDDPRFIGYTEHSVLQQLIAALERLSKNNGGAFTLMVRPHPRQSDFTVESGTQNGVTIKVSRDENELEIPLAVDLVAGMSSVLLLKAALLGCKVLSIQPGLRGADPLPNHRLGLGITLYDAAGIEPALQRLLLAKEPASDSSPARVAFPANATGRVIELIELMLDSKYEISRQAGN